MLITLVIASSLISSTTTSTKILAAIARLKLVLDNKRQRSPFFFDVPFYGKKCRSFAVNDSKL
jgi:hypothetical protein